MVNNSVLAFNRTDNYGGDFTQVISGNGALALSNSPAFTMTATETITHISVWDASTAGNLLWTAALTTSKSVVNTDTLTFTTLGVALTPLAA